MSTILLVFALVLAILAALGVPNPPQRWSLGWAAFAFFVASILFNGILPLHIGH
jgi:uncharacterized membrane protein